MLKKSLALLCCLMLAVAPLSGISLPGLFKASAADGYVWGPLDFTGAQIENSEYVLGPNREEFGIQNGAKYDNTAAISLNDGAIYFKATEGQYKAINIQTGGTKNQRDNTVGGTDYYWSSGVSFEPKAGAEYVVTFDAAVESGSGQVRVRGNNTGNWQTTDLDADEAASPGDTATAGVTYTEVEYTYTQTAGGGNLQIDTGNTPTNVNIIIDNLQIREVPQITRTVIYDMQDELGSKNAGDDFTATTVLNLAGDNKGVFKVQSGASGKIISITDRTETYAAIDIKLAQLALQSGCEYEFAITGKTTASTTVLIGQSGGGYGWKHNVNADGSGNFDLTKTFTYSQLQEEISAGLNFRIQANAKVDVEIHSIIITEIGEGGGDEEPEPEPPANSLGSTVFYDLSEDDNVTGAVDGSAFVLPSIMALKGDDSGTPLPSVTVEDGSLYISGRELDHYGIDLLRDQMKVGGNFVDGTYTIYVAGHIADDVDLSAYTDPKIKLSASESPWSTLTWQGISGDNRSFVLNYEKAYTGENFGKLGYNFRIQSENAGELPFYIDTIIVKVDSPVSLSFDFGPEDQAQYSGWWTTGGASDLEWVDDLGSGDSYALKATANGGSSNRIDNAIRFQPPVPLAAGQYRISVDYYVPTAGNESKDTMKGPSVLFNNDSSVSPAKIPSEGVAGDAGYVVTLDQWVTLEGETQEAFNTAVSTINFSFYVGYGNAHPDVWYIDNVTIEQLATLETDDWPDPEWDFNLASIKDKYAGYFLVGNIMSPDNATGHLYDSYGSDEMFIKHYNLVTAENAMKPIEISKAKGSYDFSKADELVSWAEENGINIHGHTLVWHSQSPGWLNLGAAANRADARANMVEYITTVAEHYKNKVVSWDVVNEAFENDAKDFNGTDWKTGLRTDSPWYVAYANGADTEAGESGADYIYEAYVLTRQLDPNAKLFYNDYNEEGAKKREAIAMMVEDLNAKWKVDPRNEDPNRLLIEVIGMQSHYWGGGFNVSLTETAIKRFIATGAQVAITELDMPMGTWDNPHNGRKLTEAQEKAQAVSYAQLMLTYKKYASYIDRVTFWAMTDVTSWRGSGMPGLFDNSLYAKEAYHAVMNPEKYANISGGNGGGSSSSGGGGGGGGSNTPTTYTSSNVSANGSVNSQAIASEANKALAAASGDTAILTTKNAQSISAATLKSLASAAKKAGKSIIIHADTLGADNRSIQGRLYVDPAKLANLTADLKLAVYTDSSKTVATKSLFEKYYDNKVSVIRCEQQGSFGAKLKIAAKVNLAGMDASKLVFYSYDKTTKRFAKIADTAYFIDKNGFLHFYTAQAGDIIISEGNLAKK